MLLTIIHKNSGLYMHLCYKLQFCVEVGFVYCSTKEQF